MGCSKNLVDSERVVKMLADKGIEVCHNVDGFTGDAVVINTCGFIGDAKEESVNMILEACEAKKFGIVKKVYVMGCLSQRYRDELKSEIPEVDGWYGKFDWSSIADDLLSTPALRTGKSYERAITTPSHHAYLKISEGCNRFCAFCAIPLITGRHKSRPVEEIIDEVKMLVAQGVSELNVIAQDLSAYGTDLEGGRSRLAELIDQMADIEGARRIRLHYAYPADFPYDVLDVMASRPNVCNYLDIALQHIDDKVLSNMHRHVDGRQTRELLAEIRRRVPGIFIRSTLMTGFPGEDEVAFENLLQFVREQRFERMGAFAYCEEEGTTGAKLFSDDIPQHVKDSRLDQLMALQRDIAEEMAEARKGERLEVVVDEVKGEKLICRSEFDSPEVDPVVIVTPGQSAECYHPGQYIICEVTGHDSYDLLAREV